MKQLYYSVFTPIFLILFFCSVATAEPVRFARAKSVLSLPILIAEELGYFTEEGVQVEFLTTFSGKQSVQKLLEGEVDLAVSGTPPVVKGLMLKNEYCVAATVSEADNAQKIITRKSKQILNAQDLVGKKVGVPFGTGADFGFREYLFFNGLEREDMQLLDIRPSPLSNGLEANGVDVLVIWEPLASKVREQLGDDYDQLEPVNAMLLEYVLIVSSEFRNKRKAELSKILRALNRAASYIAREPAAAIHLQSKLLNLSNEKSKVFFEEHLYRLSIGPRLVHAFERIAEMVHDDSKGKLLVPDFGEVFCEEALLSVAPQNYLLKRK